MGAVRPHLEYSSTAWFTLSRTNLQVLDTVLNQALRLITGAMRTTPIKDMEHVTNIQPLQECRDTKTLLQAERFWCQRKHPTKQRVEGLTKNRLKRSSVIHQSKKHGGEHTSLLPAKTLPLTFCQSQPWNMQGNPKHSICTTVHHVTQGDSQYETVKCALTKALIEKSTPKKHGYKYTQKDQQRGLCQMEELESSAT